MTPELADVEVPFDKEQTLAEIEATFEMPPETAVPAKPTAPPETLQMQLYDTNLEKLAVLQSKCLALEPSAGKEQYEETRQMLGMLRTVRCRVEKRRKEHNADAHTHIKFVNAVAKQLTDYIVNLEDPLKQKKIEVDDAKNRAAFAAEEAKRKAEEEKLRAEREAQEAALKAEAERLAAERAEMEAERRRLADERAAAEAERRAIEAAKEEAEREKREHEAAIRAKQEAEEAAVREAERKAALAARLEALKPDRDKLKTYAIVIRRCANAVPVVNSEEANLALANAVAGLELIAKNLDTFQGV